MVSQPIIKQRIIQTPIIKQSQTERPVYTEQVTQDAKVSNETVVRNIQVASPGNTIIKERVTQPTILTVEDEVKIMKKDNRVENLPEITKPVRYTEEVVEREYENPNQAIYFQPVFEKQIVYNQEDVQFVPTEDELLNLKPFAKNPVIRDNYREEIIVKPGNEIYNQRIFQPVIQREEVEI